MANTRRFEIEVLSDTSKAMKSLQNLGDAGVKHLNGITTAMKTMASAFVFDKLADGIGDVLDAARESEKIMKVTEQVIKSTGGAAKLTAEQIGDLATAISNKTGVDDEMIQKGSNLLLTFKNVHDEVGKGSDIFSRATQATVDLAATGFGSVESNAVMLGKALNDPIKGVAALGRAGVTFSDDQKKMIKSLQDTGNILGAQKIILGEVESQVGGTAAASANSADLMRVKWDNFKETIGTKLLPIANKLTDWMTVTAIPALEKTADWIETKVVPALQDFAEWTDEHIVPALKKAWEWIHDKVLPVFVDLGAWISKNWPTISETFKRYVDAVTESIKGIIEMGKGVITFFQGVFAGDWDKAWEGLKKVAKGAWDFMAGLPTEIAKDVMAGLKKWGPDILETLTGAFKKVFIDLPTKLASALATLGIEMGKRIASGIKDTVKNAISDAWDYIIPGKQNFGGGSGPDYSLTGAVDAGPDIMYARQPSSMSSLAALVAAIKKQETGFLAAQGKNQYTAEGPMTRYGIATGAYQFLDSTWRSFNGSTRRAKDASAAEQDAIATKAIGQYMQRYGGDPELVAIAWHAGPGAADAVKAGRRKASSFVDSAAHTNSGAYASNVAKYYRGYLGTMGSAVGGATTGDNDPVVIGSKQLKSLEDIAGSLDLQAIAMKDLVMAGNSQKEASELWRDAYEANGRSEAAAYRAIEAGLGKVEDATRDSGSLLSDTFEGSIEDIAAAFFEGLRDVASAIDEAALGGAMDQALRLGTDYTSPEGAHVRLYATDPSTGGTLFDSNGNPIYADDTGAVQRRLIELGYGTPGGGGAPSFPGGGPPIASGIGGGGTQTINLVVDGKVLASTTVDAMRSNGGVRPDGTLQALR